MSPCNLSKKTGDSDMTLVKDGLIINLPCEQATHEYSLGERIFKAAACIIACPHVEVCNLSFISNGQAIN